MRGIVVFLGLLLILAGVGVAGAQYAPVDLSVLDTLPAARHFLTTPMALYSGAGAAATGLLAIIIAIGAGGKKKDRPGKVTPSKVKPGKVRPGKVKPPEPARTSSTPVQPMAAKLQPVHAPAPAREPVIAAAPAAKTTTASPIAPMSSKPTASAQPPGVAPASDPRLLNRKRVTDLVTINDALKTYRDKRGAFPIAEGLFGFLERGAAWIPGLAPDFIAQLPRDPAASSETAGPQYVYISNGTDYKLLAQGVSLRGGTNVEVLGVKIDLTREPTPENASFGFWTPGYASA